MSLPANVLEEFDKLPTNSDSKTILLEVEESIEKQQSLPEEATPVVAFLKANAAYLKAILGHCVQLVASDAGDVRACLVVLIASQLHTNAAQSTLPSFADVIINHLKSKYNVFLFFSAYTLTRYCNLPTQLIQLLQYELNRLNNAKSKHTIDTALRYLGDEVNIRAGVTPSTLELHKFIGSSYHDSDSDIIGAVTLLSPDSWQDLLAEVNKSTGFVDAMIYRLLADRYKTGAFNLFVLLAPHNYTTYLTKEYPGAVRGFFSRHFAGDMKSERQKLFNISPYTAENKQVLGKFVAKGLRNLEDVRRLFHDVEDIKALYHELSSYQADIETKIVTWISQDPASALNNNADAEHAFLPFLYELELEDEVRRVFKDGEKDPKTFLRGFRESSIFEDKAPSSLAGALEASDLGVSDAFRTQLLDNLDRIPGAQKKKDYQLHQESRVTKVIYHAESKDLHELRRYLPISIKELRAKHTGLAGKLGNLIKFGGGKDITSEMVDAYEATLSDKHAFPVVKLRHEGAQRSVKEQADEIDYKPTQFQTVLSVQASKTMLDTINKSRSLRKLVTSSTEKSKEGGHPSSKNQIVWVRIEPNRQENYLLVDEIQSDLMKDALSEQEELTGRISQARKSLSEDAPARKTTDSDDETGYLMLVQDAKRILERIEPELKDVEKLIGMIKKFDRIAMQVVTKFAKDNGYKKIYYHTFESGNKLKKIPGKRMPPKSLYTDSPKENYFKPSKDKPFGLDGDFFERQARRLLAQVHTLLETVLCLWKLLKA